MILTQTQQREFHDKGWIVLPGALDAVELGVLDAAVTDLSTHDGPEVAREPDHSPHVVYGMHLLDDRLQTLTRHPLLVSAVEQLLGSPAFVHQTRVNIKQRDGSIVKWHQDFGTYHRVDGIPRPDGIMIGIFLDNVDATTAPVLAIPGSHRHGLVSEAFLDPESEDFETVSKYRFDIPAQTIAELAAEHGIEAITGPAGSVLLMNMTVVHGSSVNITPLRRVILYINVSAVDNRGETYARPEYYAARDFSPLQAAPADCLRVLQRKVS